MKEILLKERTTSLLKVMIMVLLTIIVSVGSFIVYVMLDTEVDVVTAENHGRTRIVNVEDAFTQEEVEFIRNEYIDLLGVNEQFYYSSLELYLTHNNELYIKGTMSKESIGKIVEDVYNTNKMSQEYKQYIEDFGEPLITAQQALAEVVGHPVRLEVVPKDAEMIMFRVGGNEGEFYAPFLEDLNSDYSE